MYCIGEGLTDIGLARDENQDAYLIDEKEGLFAVADGMGGLQNGARASSLALNRLQKIVREWKVPPDAKDEEIAASLRTAVLSISDILRKELGPNTGATLIFVLVRGEDFHIVNLGDCRAYLFEKDRLVRLTTDHNMASVLLDSGETGSARAVRHPLRNLVTRYLGMGHAVPEIKTMSPRAADRVLLCTDGLTSVVGDSEIARILGESQRHAALQELIDAANKAGGDDNITALIIDCQ